MYDSQMTMAKPSRGRFSTVLQWATEFALILFSLYAVRLMAESTQTIGQGETLGSALKDISSMTSFIVAAISAITGCIVLE